MKLLQVAAKNYGSFIYDSNQLSVIRGGSELARILPSALLDMLKDFDVPWSLEAVATGGSRGIYIVETADNMTLEEVAKSVKSLLSSSPQFRFVPISVVAAEGIEFAHVLRQLDAKAGWEKLNNHTILPEEASFSQDRKQKNKLSSHEERSFNTSVCSVTSVRSAHTNESGGLGYLSDFTAQRLQLGRELASKGGLFSRVAEVESGVLEKLKLAKSFEDFLSQSRLNSENDMSNRLAYIYFDGNRFGEISKLAEQSIKKFKKFDSELQKRRKKLLKSLLPKKNTSSLGSLYSENGTLRIIPLLWGGDESLIVVPAMSAFEVLDVLLRRTADWSYSGQPMTHAFGVLIAHYKTPVYEARAMAETLAELGKTRTRSQTTWTSAVLKSLDYVPFNAHESALMRYFRVRFGNKDDFVENLYGFTHSLMDAPILEAFQQLKTLSRSPVRRIARLACEQKGSDSSFSRALDAETRLLSLLSIGDAEKTRRSLSTIQSLLCSTVRDSNSQTFQSKEDNGFGMLNVWVLLEEYRDLIPDTSCLGGRT